MSFASIVALLQTALMLLGIVSANPSLPQATKDNATQVAQQAITQATTGLATQSSAHSPAATGHQATVAFASLTSGSAPLTVSFVAPPSAGGDYIYFGDGTDGCSVPGVTNDGMTGCSVPSGTPISHTYTKAGVYNAIVTRLGPSMILASTTITVTEPSAVTAPGMSQYTDKDFGFSFWYPSSTKVTKSPPKVNSGSTLDYSTTMNGPNTSILGIVDAPEFTAYEIYSPDRSILSSVDAGPAGSSIDKYFFDTQTHMWMYTDDGGPTGRTPGGTNPADVSHNTMGGLHVFNGYIRFGQKVIIPLSAHDFLVLYSKCNEATDYSCASGGAKFNAAIQTILATDPSVATPVSPDQQIAAIKAEQQAYAGE